MTTQINSSLYAVANGTSPSNVPIVKTTSPSISDIQGPLGMYPIGQKWVNKTSNTTYTLTSFSATSGSITANWVNDGVGSDLQTLSGDTGVASPSSGNILIAGGAGVVTSASGSTVTVALTGGSQAIDTIALQAGTSPITPTGAGLITFNGTTVAAGTNPVRTNGTGANTMALEVQLSQDLAAQDTTKVGLANFDTSFFTCTNGFVTLKSGSSGQVSIQVFTSNGTYTPTSGMDYCIVECVGGGGAGGGAPAVSVNTEVSAGSGGGAGEYARAVFTAAQIGASKAVTIGAGGTGSAGAVGGNGGTTSLGTLITAAGGTGGAVGIVLNNPILAGGAGGTGGGGSPGAAFRNKGQNGWHTFISSAGADSFTVVSGAGGNSIYGSGAAPTILNLSQGTSAGVAASNYGSGGSGGYAAGTNGNPAVAGGNGSSGLIVITEFI